jgi:hypothetical protein
MGRAQYTGEAILSMNKWQCCIARAWLAARAHFRQSALAIRDHHL